MMHLLVAGCTLILWLLKVCNDLPLQESVWYIASDPLGCQLPPIPPPLSFLCWASVCVICCAMSCRPHFCFACPFAMSSGSMFGVSSFIPLAFTSLCEEKLSTCFASILHPLRNLFIQSSDFKTKLGVLDEDQDEQNGSLKVVIHHAHFCRLFSVMWLNFRSRFVGFF